jgi:hypothetical protein
MSNLLKNLLIALGLAILLFVGYVVFIRSDEEDQYLSGADNPASVEADLETQELLATLNELRSLNVEGSIFTNPLFLSLKDFRNDLGEEPSGRSNPFLPIQ